MNIDLTKYDEQHAAYIEALSGKLESIYKSIIRLAVKYGLSVNFDSESGEIFDFDKFPKLKKKIEELFDDMHEQITTLVQNAISTEWQFSADKYDFWLSEMLDKGEMTKDEIEAYIKRNTEAIQSRRNEALEAFRKRVENGMNLSDRVWKLTEQFKSELELALDVGIGEGKSADAISRDIRQYLNNPDKLFRRVRDKHGNLKLSKAVEAYHPGQGVYRSSYKNALRVARTEVNMAYRTADHENWSAEKMVIGIRVSLSNNHTLNGKPFFDICDELKGVYPKEFKFTGWHPMCYSDDSEVYTDSGWKLFKYVLPTDRILSLNPQTRCTECVNITASQAYPYFGYLLRFFGKSIDCLVTPEHRMIYIDRNGNLSDCKAYEFKQKSGSFITHAMDGALIINDGFKKKSVFYSGIVYDLTLEKNHIMYIRRNGKCFWGSNCRCWATPITPTQAEVIDYTKKLMSGEDVSNYKFKDEVTELPKAFRFWYAKNYSRVARMRHKPNFITDNQSLIEGRPTPAIEPSVKEIKIPSIYDKIRETEQQIRQNKEFETGVVFDKNGNILVDKRGSARHVAFTRDECAKMKDAILTHNHPGGWKYAENKLGRVGNSFSGDDIVLAIAYNLEEIRAVTPLYTFSMKRPKDGWGINWKKARESFASAKSSVNKYMNAYFDKVGRDVENHERANAIFYHLVNRKLAKKYGWEYTKTKG